MPSTARPINVAKYLEEGPHQSDDLIFGFRRPGPRTKCPGGAAILRRLRGGMGRALRSEGAGVMVSPVDLVLDEANGLILHPPIAVLLPQRLQTLRADCQIWGAPNLVVELLWPATARRTRCSKLRWYANYGVEECWLIDTRRRRIEVLDFSGATHLVPCIYSGSAPIQSRVLPRCVVQAVDLFATRSHDPRGPGRPRARGRRRRDA